VIGPALAGVLVAVHLTAPLFVVVVLALVSAASVWLFLPERTRPNAFEREQARVQQRAKKRLRFWDDRVLPFLIIGFAIGTVQAMTFQTIAFFIMDKLRLDANASIQFTSVAFLATAMAALFAQFVLIDRFRLTTRFMVRSGLFIALCSNLFIALSVNYGMIVVGFFTLGLGLGLVRPGLGAAASLAVSKDEQGAVAGLTNAMGAAGHIVGPLLGPALYRYWTPEAPYILNTILLVACVVYIYGRNIARSRTTLQPDQADSGVPKG